MLRGVVLTPHERRSENSLKLSSSYENEKNMEIANSEQRSYGNLFILFCPIIYRNAVKNYQKKKNYSSRVYFTICTHCIYVYIYARLYLSQHSFNDLNLFRRAISRHGTKQNKTNKNETHRNIDHPFLLSVSGKLPSYIFSFNQLIQLIEITK